MAAFLALALAVAVIGAVQMRSMVAESRNAAHKELSAVAEMKAAEISAWYRERLADAEGIFDSERIQSATLGYLENPSDMRLRAELVAWMVELYTANRYRLVALYGSDGTVELRIPPEGDPASDGAEVQAALRAKGVVEDDLHLGLGRQGESASSDRLSFWIPVRGGDGPGAPTPGTWELRADAQGYLYPRLQAWPIPSRTAEAILLRRKGEESVFLTGPQGRPDAGRRMPVAGSLADRAVWGWEGVTEGIDDRGVPVVAAARRIQGTPWSLELQEDQDEAFAPMRTRMWATGLGLSAMLLAAALVVSVLWRRRDKQWLLGQIVLEQERQALAERVLFLNRNANDIIQLLDEEWRIVEANDRALEAYGYSLEELQALKAADLRAPEVRGAFEEQAARLGVGEGLVLETVHQRKDGSRFPVEISMRSVELGGQTYRQSIIRDITERRRVEDALRESEARYRSLFDDAAVPIWEQDLSAVKRRFDELRDAGVTDFRAHFEAHPEEVRRCAESIRILDVNRESLRVTKADRKEDLVRHLPSYFEEDSWPVFTEELIALAEGRTEFQGEISIRDLRGERRELALRLSVPREHRGTLDRALVSFVDITERKSAAEVHGAILAAAMDGFCVADAAGRFLDVNEAFCEMHGYARDELLGMAVAEIEAEERPEEVTGRIERMIRNGPDRFESRHLRKDGSLVDVEVSIHYLANQGGRIFSFVRDITERRRAETTHAELEEQLRQAQKMEAIGTLAGGIAHDFNNILTPVLAHAELALLELSEGDPIRDDVEQILKGGERAADLVRQILTIARKGDHAVTSVNLASLVKEMVKFLRASFPSTIEIVTKIDPSCLPVAADPSQLHQLFLNLCTNARDAMEERGGTLTVSLEPVGSVSSDPPGGEGTNGVQVKLVVQDTGTGIPEDILGHIFEPYFTTKPAGKGTGLGLAVVHGIVASLGGDIRVDSREGQGTRFEVLLPAEPEEQEQGLPPPPAAPRGRGERILVVDDEESVTSIVQRILEALGYRVSAFTSSPAAIDAFRASPADFDAVLTDQTMPRLTGLDLAREIRAVNGSVPVLLGTGLTDGMDRTAVCDLGVRRVILKPYDRRTLATAVHEVLGDRDGSGGGGNGGPG